MPENDAIDDELAEFRSTGPKVFDDILKSLSNRRANTGSLHFNEDIDLNEKENNTSTTTSSRATKKTPASSSRAKVGARGNASGPSTKNQLNITVNKTDFEHFFSCILINFIDSFQTSRKTQPTIAQALSQRSTRHKKTIQYELDSD